MLIYGCFFGITVPTRSGVLIENSGSTIFYRFHELKMNLITILASYLYTTRRFDIVVGIIFKGNVHGENVLEN